MSVRKALSTIFGIILAFVVIPPAAHADEWTQLTKLSFNQPVALPHVILPAGPYWFEIPRGFTDRNVVQVFSSDWSHLYATLLTAPTYRAHSTNRTQVTFAERPSDRPEALLKWYYPGRQTGHEFLYSSKKEHEFQRDPKQVDLGHRLKVRS
jgi:hypothetical protein